MLKAPFTWVNAGRSTLYQSQLYNLWIIVIKDDDAYSVKLPLKSNAPPMVDNFGNPLIVFSPVLFAI